MAKHTIKVSLSETSIQEAIRQLQLYKQTLQYKCEQYVERLAELGDKAAIYSISESPLGKTVSMRVEKESTQMGCKAVLIATGKTVEVEGREPFYTLLAIEFGAGIYYNNGNENPKANEFGLGVGTYPGQIHAFEDGWYYLGEDNQWHYTHGTKATMPMYNASMEMIAQYKQIAREVFG